MASLITFCSLLLTLLLTQPAQRRLDAELLAAAAAGDRARVAHDTGLAP